jgi:protein SCO1/2
MRSTKTKLLYGSLLVMVLAVAVIIHYYNAAGLESLPASIRDIAVNPPVVLQDFVLYNQENKKTGLQELGGHWTFLFFGYTSCPDVCPATLSQLAVINKKIRRSGKVHDNPEFYFVSVDPARDSTEQLANYLKYFDKSFVGLTGEMPQILALEKQFNVFHQYGKKQKDGFYTVAHSADTFLIDAEGRIVAKFQPPMNTDLVVNQYLDLIAMQEQQTSS